MRGFLVLVVALSGCSSSAGPSGSGGSGGTPSTGGSGGMLATGGSGGTPSTGGSGGTLATGGSGGTPSTGGSGGSAGTGGAAGHALTGGTAGTAATGGTAGIAATGGAGGKPAAGGAAGSAAGYDTLVLADGPVAYWAMAHASGMEPDLTGNRHDGTYKPGLPAAATMPNGDAAADFDGATQYLTVPSSAVFSIPTTGDLTWEAWIRPDVLQFQHSSGGYVDWMGKCESYGPTCEWEARMYSTTNSENRCNRLSAYVFNPSAGLGSAADWQPTCGLITAGAWLHVVGEYTLHSQPSTCTQTGTYPGSINIWVNGILWDQAAHDPTGCMSQYMVVPQANSSPLDIATMAKDAWFAGAIGKVAIYDKLLPAARITAHFQAMANHAPTGSCGNTCSY